MKKLSWVILAVVAGIISFGLINRTVARTLAAANATDRECVLAANRVAEAEKISAEARAGLLRKKNSLRDAARHPKFSPDLLALLENEAGKGSPNAWAELRAQLGIGWDSSPDFVLVRKGMLKQLHFGHVNSDGGRVRYDVGATGQLVNIMAVSPDERSAVLTVLENVREKQALGVVQRTPPGGDIVAQYTMPAADPVFQQSASNTFSASISGVLGPERAALLVPRAWNEIDSIWPSETETLTVRQTEVAGQPVLVYDLTTRGHTSTNRVRDGQSPTSWFTALFPGGWASLAEREGFSLPAPLKN